MPRHPSRLGILALALSVLVFLVPVLATALPQGGVAVLAPAERAEASPSLFAQLWGLLSVLWAETGSGLGPNGASARLHAWRRPDRRRIR